MDYLVKAVEANNSNELEDKINEWLQSNRGVELIDVKWQTVGYGESYFYLALVIYKV